MSITQTINDNYQLEPTPAIEELFCNYTELTEKLENCASGYTSEGSEERADNLFAEQFEIIRTAISTPATNAREILFKMAIWRWDAPDLEALNKLYRHDALAYSVFRDLAELTGASCVMKDGDACTDLSREGS